MSTGALLGILIFGLNPRDFCFSNQVRWITDQPGIRFAKYGIAYTAPFLEPNQDKLFGRKGFSIEIALKPEGYDDKGFNFVWVLHNGNDDNQLLMGQWRSWLILMNGDDYDHKKKTKRLSLNAASPSPTARFLTITTGKEGTHIYVDGRLFRTKKDLILNIPDGAKSKLVFGNSVYGRHSWQGDVYGWAFYGDTLSELDAARHYAQWSETHSFKFAKGDNPLVVYIFDEKEGLKALDQGNGKHHLEIPAGMPILTRKILSSSWDVLTFNRNTIQDIILNLLGFIPLGFLLTATMINRSKAYEKHGVLITIVFCFMVSLIIETAQAWLPSRSSQMLDLILNTLGALMGATAGRLFMLRVYQDKRIERQ